MCFILYKEKKETKNEILNKFFTSQKHILDIKEKANVCKLYTNDKMFTELSEVLKSDKYFNQNSVLIQVCLFLLIPMESKRI